MTRAVTRNIPGTVTADGRGIVHATFVWRADDPLIVMLMFPTGARWPLGRDSLTEGLRRQVGDPRFDPFLIQPATAGVVIHDMATGVVLAFDREALRDALLASWQVCPLGFVDIDAVLGSALGEAR